MMRRRGRPGLVGTMARTAVVAGTATAVAGSVHGHQQKKAQEAYTEDAAQQAAFDSQQQIAEMQAQMNAMQAQQAAAPPPPSGSRSGRGSPGGGPGPDDGTLQAGRPEGGRNSHGSRIHRGKSQAAGLIERHDDRRRGHVFVHLP